MSTDLALVPITVPPMTPAAIARVRELETYMLATEPQFKLKMQHFLHLEAGLYARVCYLPADRQMTGALIKLPTLLLVEGNVLVCLGEEVRELTGSTILMASAGRKQAFRAITDTKITMIFPTMARTVAEAEREMTEEWERLAPGDAETFITGESA